ncbi:MAG: SDR family oxidoreductase [Planctomycetota bacterium]
MANPTQSDPQGDLERPTLITGATGFLGAHVVGAAVARAQREATFADPLGRLVVAAGREVLLAPRYTTPRDAAQWIPVDLLADLPAFLARVNPSEVIHCAALSRAKDCQEDPALAQRVNAQLAGEVAAWCHGHGARLIHVSTDLVFGAEDAPRGGLAEGAAPAPISVYGASKLAGERAVLAACPGALVARLPLLYGDSAGRGLGASDALLAAVERDEVPPLFVDEFRTPLEVSNAARALVELLDHNVSGVLHVAGPERVSRHALGLAVLGAMGLARNDAAALVRPVEQASVDTGAPRPRDVSLDARRATRLLQTTVLGLERGLAPSLGPG